MLKGRHQANTWASIFLSLTPCLGTEPAFTSEASAALEPGFVEVPYCQGTVLKPKAIEHHAINSRHQHDHPVSGSEDHLPFWKMNMQTCADYDD